MSLHGEDPIKGVIGPGQMRRGSYQGSYGNFVGKDAASRFRLNFSLERPLKILK